jgi:hypothetical protein
LVQIKDPALACVGVMRAARSTVAWVIAIACVVAGVGLTYLLRHSAALDFGPRIGGALPLQQLAGGEAQPLGRMAVAWLCAGGVAGLALAGLARSGILARTIALALIAGTLLLLSGAVSDVVAISDHVGLHLAPQLSRTGIWVADALFVGGSLGAYLAARWSSGRAPRLPARARLPSLWASKSTG